MRGLEKFKGLLAKGRAIMSEVPHQSCVISESACQALGAAGQARIAAAAGALYSMTSDRPYRKGTELGILRRSWKMQRDPEVAKAFGALMGEGAARILASLF